MADSQKPASPPIDIRNLYKIFGTNPSAYSEAVKGGMTKKELNEKHHHVLGLRDINISMPGGGITVVMAFQAPANRR